MEEIKSEHAATYAAARNVVIPGMSAVTDALKSMPRNTTVGMLAAMLNTGKHVYAGTVDPVTVAQNRAQNKRARVARRVSRQRGFRKGVR